METIKTPTETERRIPMSYAEFLQRIEDSTHAEWVNGEAILFMPSGTQHQRIIKFLLFILDQYVRHFRLGEVLQAPFLMKLSPSGNAREPDILFIADANRERITPTSIAGAADLVIEVISPESVARDRGDKFYEYQAAGVREYWLIDPRPGYERADFWLLDGDGRYQPVPLEEGRVYRSTVLRNFWFDTTWLWADPMPDAMVSFAVIANLDDLQRALRDAGIGG